MAVSLVCTVTPNHQLATTRLIFFGSVVVENWRTFSLLELFEISLPNIFYGTKLLLAAPVSKHHFDANFLGCNSKFSNTLHFNRTSCVLLWLGQTFQGNSFCPTLGLLIVSQLGFAPRIYVTKILIIYFAKSPLYCLF